MKPDKFFYTDGYNVVVTNTKLIVKNTRYLMKSILDFGLVILKPLWLPGILVTLLGVLLITNAFLSFIPPSLFHKLSVPEAFSATYIQILTGAGIVIIGIIYILAVRKRFAVRIVTSEGSKDVLVSRRKDYIEQILTAIRKAKFAAFGSE